MAKSKFYVVKKGRKPGIYLTWADCQEQVHHYQGAVFKSYATREEAEKAFRGEEGGGSSSSSTGFQENSLSVDAACSGNPGVLEYQGVDTKTGERLFHGGPYSLGTNNLGEFLGIVHGLRYLKNENSDSPIYSDSATAIAWVRNKAVKTNLVRNEKTKAVWQDIEDAVRWLKDNTWENPIVKWETHEWGEIKADFGRK